MYKLFIIDLTQGSPSDNSSACLSLPVEHYKWALALRGELQKHLSLGESEATPRVCCDCRKKKKNTCVENNTICFPL